MNHGAEHKVIGAFINHDLKNVDKYSRFSDMCGGNIFSMIIILILISPIIRFPFTISLIYVVIYTKVKPARWIFFNTIGKATQRLTTEEPTKEILENTKIGLEKLMCVETKKILEDIVKDVNLGKEDRLIYEKIKKILDDTMKDNNPSSKESQTGNNGSA